MNKESEKIWTGRLTLLTLIGSILGGVYYYAQKEENNEHRRFSTPEIKYETERVVPLMNPMASYRDSIIEARHRSLQDSMDRVRDTLTKRNAVTTYQNKQRLDSVTILLKQMKESLDHTLEHVEH